MRMAVILMVHLKRFPKIGGIGNQRMNEDHLNYSIVKIGLNTKKSPGGLSEIQLANAGVKKKTRKKWKQYLTRQNLDMAKKRKL